MTAQATGQLLAGVRVIDLTWALSGPFCTLILAGLGADVIKVENPSGPDSSRGNAPFLGRDGLSLLKNHEDDMSLGHIVRSRGKRAVTLNLKHPRGREVFADLVRDAHIVVENFSRGALDRLGVGYSWGATINPRIVYCSITGFGLDGPPGTGKAMDVVIQALSGLMLASGDQHDPPIRSGVPLGAGQKMTRLVPFGIFRTSDGFVSLAAPTDRQIEAVLSVMGRPELLHDERFRTRDRRVSNARALEEIVEAWTSTLTTAEVVALLDGVGVPAAEVREPAEAVRDERVVLRGETAPLHHPEYAQADDVYGTGLPIHFSGAEAGFTRPAPWVGQHNDEIYGELLGYSPETVAQLRADGVI